MKNIFKVSKLGIWIRKRFLTSAYALKIFLKCHYAVNLIFVRKNLDFSFEIVLYYKLS